MLSFLLRFCLRKAGGGERSVGLPIIPLPFRILRLPTVGSLPSLKTKPSRYAGLKSVALSQFGLRTNVIRRPGW